jgi:predicted DNA-binding protein (MmcQ/YjbR family)
MTQENVDVYILSFGGVVREYPFGENVAVYKIGGSSSPEASMSKMFALVEEKKTPVNLSLKCDPLLAKTLREKYETVMPGQHLNKKHWNTIILSGQLNWPEVQDLIRHAHDLAINESH